MTETRKETDSLGVVEVPADKLGAITQAMGQNASVTREDHGIFGIG